MMLVELDPMMLVPKLDTLHSVKMYICALKMKFCLAIRKL